mgnify:CR=1 FL=1
MEWWSSNSILFVTMAILLAALVLTFVRLAKGPSVHDRIVALDLTASIIMGFIISYSILVQRSLYFDVAIVISLVAFIGTVAVSTYLKIR